LEVIHYKQQKKCHWGSSNVKMIKLGPYCNTQKGKEKQTKFAIIERLAAAPRMTDILYQVCTSLF